MTNSLPATEFEETIPAVTARIREWVALRTPGIVWIRYVSDVSRDLVISRISGGAEAHRIEFDPPDPVQAASWLEERLRSIPIQDSPPVVTVVFSPLLAQGKEAAPTAFQSLNLRREVIARVPLIQLWWIPSALAPIAEAEALDLASWFQIKVTLGEVAPAVTPEYGRQSREPRRWRPGQQSLQELQEAVARQRRLASMDAPSYLPQLAVALNNLARGQSEMGQRAEALQSIQEAVRIRRELVANNAEAFLPDLAMALNNLANSQSEMGKRAEALQSIQEGVQHYRELVAKNREAFLPDLAMALNNLANRQSAMGQRAEALQSIQEALRHYRELVANNREAFLPGLAAALNNLANRQSEMGQRAEALQSIQEAVQHYRELVAKNREAFLPNLAGALNNLANLQSAMGQRAEALQSIQEAVKIRRDLVAKNREAFLPVLALSHGAWGSILLGCERPAEAAEKFAEGVRLITPLALSLPQAHFELAWRLAGRYRSAALAAGIEPDPECTRPLDVMERLKQHPGEEERRE